MRRYHRKGQYYYFNFISTYHTLRGIALSHPCGPCERMRCGSMRLPVCSAVLWRIALRLRNGRLAALVREVQVVLMHVRSTPGCMFCTWKAHLWIVGGGSRTVVRSYSTDWRIAMLCAQDSRGIMLIPLRKLVVWPHQATSTGRWTAYRLALPPERHAASPLMHLLGSHLRTVLGVHHQHRDLPERHCATFTLQ